MRDDRDTDTIEVSGFDDTDARLVLPVEQGYDDTLDLGEIDPTARISLRRARTQPDWPPTPPPPRSTSRRHKAVYVAVSRPQTSSDSV